MAQSSARRLAVVALKIWRAKRSFADSIISELFAKTRLQPADRAFSLELFYGVLRNLTLLDFWIGQLRAKRVDVDLRDLLRLGLYQLFIPNIAEHAAVHETVDLAPKRHRAIANAILRSAVREREELERRANDQPLDVRASHPRFLIERWQTEFGDDATKALSTWNNRPPQIYARINQLKIDRQKFLRRYRDARFLPDVANFVELPKPTKAIEAGDCYVQDPSTAIACALLDPQPEENILDACAAPGGKTSYIAELMKNRGLLVACDREPERLRLLKQNLSGLGAINAKIVRQDWTKPPISPEILSAAPFDRILVDAPCSNTGVMRRRVDVRWRLTPKDFARMHARQVAIVRAIVPLLKPGGVLVYSTCSLEREENEEVVLELLQTMPMLQLECEKNSFPFQDNFDGAFAARIRRKN